MQREPATKWRPIAELPEALKDGRDVLMFFPEAEGRWVEDSDEPVYTPQMAVMRWEGGWEGYYPIGPGGEPTHFAEITPPEEK